MTLSQATLLPTMAAGMSGTPFQQSEEGCRLAGVDRWVVSVDGIEVGLQARHSRAMPWTSDLRLPRFGRNIVPDALPGVVAALVERVSSAKVLRLRVEVWDEDDDRRARVARILAAAGFHRADRSASYDRTVWINLQPSEDEIMAEFHSTGRRHIRAPAKKGFEVRTVEQDAAIPALSKIHCESFARTGGRAPDVDWKLAVELNRAPDSPLRLVGLYREDMVGDAPPVAFAMAFLHGEVAEYAHAGSIRDPSIRIPMLYSPTWELMRWARDRGAHWWDFGGITSGTEESNDPRGGISDFKRYFSENTVTVGEEWWYEPGNLASTLARKAQDAVH